MSTSSRVSPKSRRWAWLCAAWGVMACARFGYDLLPPEETLDAGDADAASGVDASGSGGLAGAGGAPGGSGGDGGSDVGGSGGSGGSGASGGAGGVAGDTGGDDGGLDGGFDGAAAAGGASPDDGGAAGGTGGTDGAGGSGVTPPPTCDDGEQNGDETYVDCGGAVCVPCGCSFGAPERLGNPNYTGNALFAPSVSNDGRSLYIAVIVPGSDEQIGVSTRPDRGDTFGFASSLDALVNQSTEGTPHIARDGRSLYFYSLRSGGAGGRDLYVARRSSTSGEFTSVTRLSSVNSSAADHLPWISSDELRLYFSSNRGGDMDIWMATRGASSDTFGAPTRVADLSSTQEDSGVTFTQDERVAILSSLRTGSQGRDLYQAVRATQNDGFSSPQPIAGLNSGADESDPALSPDGEELFFVSTRNGGASEIYRSIRTCP